MQILITIKEKKMRLSILKKGKEEAYKNIQDEHSLSEVILLEIDKLLKKNQIAIQDIKKVEVASDQTDNFTTTRIAKSVANTWNWTIENQGK